MFEDFAETAEEARVVGEPCDRCGEPFAAGELVIAYVEADVNFAAFIHAVACATITA